MTAINSRNKSQTLSPLDRTPSSKTFYINDELRTSKDIATIFHSPFKDGKRNQNYVNPTFISSNLFYDEKQVQRQLTPKHNLIYNKNQRSKKDLYAKRIQKQDYIVNTIHQVVAYDHSTRKRNMKFNEQSTPTNRQRMRQSRGDMRKSVSRSRIGVKQQNNQQMKKQLQTLIQFRQKDQRKQQQLSRRIYTNIQYNQSMDNFEQLVTPIYSQKNRQIKQQWAQAENKKNLQQWMELSTKIRKLKNQQHKKINDSQHKVMDKFIVTNYQRNYMKQMQSKKNANLLANILREQIKQSQARKIKQRQQRNGIF